jgi:hypothetical protein
MSAYFISALALLSLRGTFKKGGNMKEPQPRQEDLDETTEEVREKRRRQSREKSIPDEAPLKNNGQPAWRDVKPG